MTANTDLARLARRHLAVGWWALLVFLTLGAILEILHGFKLAFYLDVDMEPRRLMWRLAHAHGALLSLVHVALGLTLRTELAAARGNLRLASVASLGALVLIPGGFFLGGVRIYGGDPHPAILLVPPGAVLLFVAVAIVARACSSAETRGD